MKRSIIIFAVAGLALMIWNSGCSRQAPSTIGLTPDLQEIAALAQNRTSDENIIGYIRNSGKTYKVTANDIVILSKNRVSQNVLAVLMQAPAPSAAPVVVAAAPVIPPAPVAPAPATPAPVVITVNNTTATTPAAPTPAFAATAPIALPVAAPTSEPPASPEYFKAQLAPYGQWVYLPEFGTECWLPAALPPGWRPYFDNGHWQYTDSGMYWASDHPWGAIPFHYGRWVYRDSWLWVPAYEYAPSWVLWRHTEGHMGWAPVPPGALFVAGGWEFHGRAVAVDFDFGLAPTLFIFVGSDHFLEHDFHRYELHGDEWHRAFAHSEINHFVHDEHGRGFRVEGFEHEHVEHLLGHKVEVIRHEEIHAHAVEALHREAAPEPHPVMPHNAAPAERTAAPHAAAERPAEAREATEPKRAEVVSHAPAREEKTSRAGAPTATAEPTDTAGRTAKADPRQKRNSSDQPPANQN